MKKLIIGFVMFWWFSVAAIAGDWVGWTTVEEVYVADNGAINTKFGVMDNSESCNSISWIQTDSGNGAKDRILSVLLAALATGKEVRYYRSGCSNYPLMKHVMVRK